MLEHLSLETLSSQVLEFDDKARANQLEHISDDYFFGKLLVFPANIRLDWKVIASTNTLAYLASPTVTKEKCFIILTPGRLQQHHLPSTPLGDMLNLLHQ